VELIRIDKPPILEFVRIDKAPPFKTQQDGEQINFEELSEEARKEMTRVNVIREIIETEKDYVRDLEAIINASIPLWYLHNILYSCT
jgi:predicted nucleic acid-binding OB-fold protein